jgi:hypothetical protein
MVWPSRYLSSTAKRCSRAGMEAFEDILEWLSKFYRVSEAYFVEDDLATTYATCACAVLLAAKLDTRSAALIASLSRLPKEFVAALMRKVDQAQFWVSEEFADLERAVRCRVDDFPDIAGSLSCLMEMLWLRHIEEENVKVFMSLRGSRLVGGGFQDWVDEEGLSEFLESLHGMEDLRSGISKRRRSSKRPFYRRRGR